MQSIPKKVAASSELFRIIIANNQCFTIHSSLLAHQSAPLNALINGSFEEATKGEVHWDDVDEKTFLAFWEYVYTGNYTTSEPIVEPDKLDSTTPPKAESVQDSASEDDNIEPPQRVFRPELWRLPFVEEHWLTKRQRLLKDFKKLWGADSPVLVDESHYDPEWIPTSHVELAMHHIRVYILADRYGVAGLMHMSSEKLYNTLVDYVVYELNLNGIVAILRFCFNETESVPERLQEVVTHFAACSIEDLWKNNGFQNFVEESGGFSRILVEKMIARLR